ncbi:MAG: alkaline phosphatase family protein [Candidatus Aminicenantes bacterium]|nr:alkaline phosphatase family protein [Candidatus Aminicenantes bacterium]
MKFLKALLNSLLCGLCFCFLLALLVDGLNINSRLSPWFLAGLSLELFPIYGLAATVLSLLVFFITDFFSAKRNNIFFVSPTFLTLGFSLVILTHLLIFQANIRHFRSFFEPPVLTHLNRQKAVLLSLGLLGITAVILFYRLKKKPLVFWASGVLFAAGLAVLVWQRPPALPSHRGIKTSVLEAPRIESRLTLLGMEGLSFDFIIPLLAEGQLPNFSLLVENGSWGRLSGFTPNESEVLGASLDTGKLPAKHRRLSAFSYRLGSHPQRLDVIPRFLFFSQLSKLGFLKSAPAEPSLRLTDLWRIFSDCGLSVLRRDRFSEAGTASAGQKAETAFSLLFPDMRYETSPLFTPARQSFFRDSLFEEEVNQERQRLQPQVFSLTLSGLNTVEKYFYQYSFPDLYSGVDAAEAARFGSVIEKYYRFYDRIIGRYLTSLKEDETLIVYSPHGIEPLPFWKRLLGWVSGRPGVSAAHEQAPDGVIFFYGQKIARARNIEGFRVIDLAPTLLYFLGLPVGRDMDGIARSQVFVKEFTAENPIFTISSYEDIRIKAPEP